MRKPTVVTKFKKSILFGNPLVLTGQKALIVRSLAWSVSAGYTNTQKAARLAPSPKLNSRENHV